MDFTNLEILTKEIELQKRIIKQSFPSKDNRFSILELTRCWDNIFVLVVFLMNKSDEEYKSKNDLFEFISNGFFGALNLFYNDSVNRDGCPLHVSNQESIYWANRVLINMGHIGHFTKLLELYKQKVFSIEQKKDSFYFKNLTPNPGREALGANDFYFWQMNKLFHKDVNQRLLELKPTIEQQLFDEVEIWNGDFIKYGCTPELDEFYELSANEYSQRMHSYDAFPNYVKFGNLYFSDILEIVKALIGYTLKHKDHCLALLKKSNYSINPWNIYPMPYLLQDIAYSISIHKNLVCEHVLEILKAITLTEKNISFLGNAPGDSAPPLIKIGKNHVLQSIGGCLSNPFSYMVRALKYHFEKDYFKAVNEREKVFQQELYDLFESDSIYKSCKNINIRANGKLLTDIDALLFDDVNKRLVIIQLKWMDDFSTSMSKRFSMAKNFYDSSIKWIDKMESWIKTNGIDNLMEYLDNVKSIRTIEVENIELLILGRNFSHFSDKMEDKRAIWCSWYRLLKIVTEDPLLKTDLTKLLNSLRTNSIQNESIPVNEEMNLQIGKYKILISI